MSPSERRQTNLRILREAQNSEPWRRPYRLSAYLPHTTLERFLRPRSAPDVRIEPEGTHLSRDKITPCLAFFPLGLSSARAWWFDLRPNQYCRRLSLSRTRIGSVDAEHLFPAWHDWHARSHWKTTKGPPLGLLPSASSSRPPPTVYVATTRRFGL